ncbi:hypothetical protein INR49_014413 [Caranx melampygus]|nr:hypothetical protein INR49_014413 [Caranx melampygus]
MTQHVITTVTKSLNLDFDKSRPDLPLCLTHLRITSILTPSTDSAQHLLTLAVLCCSPSKQQRASVSSEDTESGRSSPDPQSHSPKHQHNRRSEYMLSPHIYPVIK